MLPSGSDFLRVLEYYFLQPSKYRFLICQIIGDFPPLITTLLKLQHSLLPDSGLQLVVVTALHGDPVVFASDALAGIGSQYFLSILIRSPRSTLLTLF